MSFEEREHTADILMHIRAPDLCRLFTDAGRALMKTMYRGEAKPVQDVIISVSGDTIEHLLHGFLSELLYESEVQNLVFSYFDITISEGEIRAVLKGELFDPKIHGGGTEVKGISWYGLSIKQDQNEYFCDVLFDV
ncbi:archease [Methanospirillum sp. J.3.6.1-F.2.7.3]|uniref:Archease n=1 Tax=Methanospirillum purgamenti TaxID=2834276 RepID=A0A8E7AYG7_9EURY|nr:MULTISPECIES: archease [Methanospirillum]MDX8551741.1 archease [Methanospirillum hungatei]QVV89110.1 archease [Methanospirillum sp. J.3.6.1-F.2.7.3]